MVKLQGPHTFNRGQERGMILNFKDFDFSGNYTITMVGV
jgi:hypothetical protein